VELCHAARREIEAIFETDIVPNWLALLEWNLPAVSYVQLSDWQKKYAAYSAALFCEAIMRLELSR
jgi:hypothetical protein